MILKYKIIDYVLQKAVKLNQWTITVKLSSLANYLKTRNYEAVINAIFESNINFEGSKFSSPIFYKIEVDNNKAVFVINKYFAKILLEDNALKIIRNVNFRSLWLIRLGGILMNAKNNVIDFKIETLEEKLKTKIRWRYNVFKTRILKRLKLLRQIWLEVSFKEIKQWRKVIKIRFYIYKKPNYLKKFESKNDKNSKANNNQNNQKNKIKLNKIVLKDPLTGKEISLNKKNKQNPDNIWNNSLTNIRKILYKKFKL